MRHAQRKKSQGSNSQSTARGQGARKESSGLYADVSDAPDVEQLTTSERQETPQERDGKERSTYRAANVGDRVTVTLVRQGPRFEEHVGEVVRVYSASQAVHQAIDVKLTMDGRTGIVRRVPRSDRPHVLGWAHVSKSEAASSQP